MRICLTLLLFAVNSLALAQFSDDFSDGDFTNSPTWTGQTANFVVTPSNELRLMAPAVADTSYLSLPTTNIDNTTWDFYVLMDFNPSASNFTRVYLVSDQADLKASLNGYFVMLGGTSDEISLYRQDGTTTTEIIDGVDGTLSSDPSQARVQVTRDALGNWELFRDTTGNYGFFSEGTVLDATHTSNSNFGVFCKYTSSRSTLFYFDQLGDPFVDSNPPTLDTVIVISATQLDVQFSEPMDQITGEVVTNYSVDQGIGFPTMVTQDGGDASLFHLTFATAFTNGTTYLMTVNNAEDLGGNPVMSPSTQNFTYIVLSTPVPGDVVITEFMADPAPSVGQPEVEYVELYNTTTNKYFDLNNWELSDGSSTGSFGTYFLGPQEYVLVTGNGDGAQFFISNFTELSLPTLTNGGDNIILRDDLSNTLDSLTYDVSWYQDASKEDGGWSIEKMNYASPCQISSNWSASVDAFGGTPGFVNSVFTTQPDATPPFISSFIVNGNNNIVATFNEELDTTFVASVIVNPTVTSLNWNYVDKLTLNIDALTLQQNQIYTVTVSGAGDCSMNVMPNQDLLIGVPDSIGIEDLILNEVMFNPLTNGSDYVEIYNNSTKILDLSEVFLANWDDTIANYESVSSVQRLILPQEYVLVTEDTNDIKNDFSIYGVGSFIESGLPTYSNDSGTVYLLSKDYIVLDYFHYDEDFHFDLLTNEDGKSLERISFAGPMNNPDNWHTASEQVEWGTPGYENSQLFIANPSGTASLDPPIFSPDNDGYQDVLTINLDLQTINNVVDVEIFDSHGRLIRLLKDNFFAGNQVTFIWDGITDDGEKARIGTYVILVSVLDENGNQEQYKLVAVLAGNL